MKKRLLAAFVALCVLVPLIASANLNEKVAEEYMAEFRRLLRYYTSFDLRGQNPTAVPEHESDNNVAYNIQIQKDLTLLFTVENDGRVVSVQFESEEEEPVLYIAKALAFAIHRNFEIVDAVGRLPENELQIKGYSFLYAVVHHNDAVHYRIDKSLMNMTHQHTITLQ